MGTGGLVARVKAGGCTRSDWDGDGRGGRMGDRPRTCEDQPEAVLERPPLPQGGMALPAQSQTQRNAAGSISGNRYSPPAIRAPMSNTLETYFQYRLNMKIGRPVSAGNCGCSTVTQGLSFLLGNRKWIEPKASQQRSVGEPGSRWRTS
jgi:hypothetical protein